MLSRVAGKVMELPVADDEWRVVARIASGEREALAELYARHRGPLLVYLRSLLRDAGLAEEVLQDTLYAAWTGAAGFARRSSVRVWLLGIARRRAHDALRRRRLQLVDDAALSGVPAPDPEPESLAIVGAERDALYAALWRLSPAHREVLVLNFLEELPYRDIAAVLGVPIGTVMSRLHHAKRALRTELTGDGRS
jgi:RNA polymerase sigma-70 factor (ECF subfamily)